MLVPRADLRASCVHQDKSVFLYGSIYTLHTMTSTIIRDYLEVQRNWDPSMDSSVMGMLRLQRKGKRKRDCRGVIQCDGLARASCTTAEALGAEGKLFNTGHASGCIECSEHQNCALGPEALMLGVTLYDESLECVREKQRRGYYFLLVSFYVFTVWRATS